MVLEDRREPLGAQGTQPLWPGAHELVAAHAHRAGDVRARRQQTQRGQRQRRLARTALADQGDRLAGGDLQVDVAQRRDTCAVALVDDREVAHRQRGSVGGVITGGPGAGGCVPGGHRAGRADRVRARVRTAVTPRSDRRRAVLVHRTHGVTLLDPRHWIHIGPVLDPRGWPCDGGVRSTASATARSSAPTRSGFAPPMSPSVPGSSPCGPVPSSPGPPSPAASRAERSGAPAAGGPPGQILGEPYT